MLRRPRNRTVTRLTWLKNASRRAASLAGMIAYWCRFFDAGGRIFGAEAMQAENDAAVMARAQVIFDHGIGDGYEIWDGKRLVLRSVHARFAVKGAR